LSAELLATFQIWRNPAFLRFWRSRLRLRKAIFWYLLTLIITTFVVSIIYIGRTNAFTPPQNAARGLWIPLLIIQGLILMVKGTGSVSAGLIQDKIDETLDYQRLTPVTPIRNLVGYLFGLPVLEYVMFALTLPHLIFIVVVGRIPLGTLLSVYLAFFVCAILYHTTAIAAGMVMRRWFLGYIVGILLVLFVNVVLPLFISQLGLKFFQYLSVWPVIGDNVLPLTVSGAALAFAAAQNPFFSMANDVPFFNWSLPPLAFTLMLQGILVVTFATMVLRRWQSSSRHSLGKPYALGFLSAFIVVLLGNVWPIITHRFMPFALFGEIDIDRLEPVIPIGLPLVYSLVTWALCFVLFAIVVPSRHSYVRGIRRALKHGRSAARPWNDDAGGLAFIAVVTAVALAGFGVMFREIAASGFLDRFEGYAYGFWRLPLAFGLAIFYSGLVLQVLELKPTVLVILLVWFLPILVGIVVSASAQDVGYVQTVIASISPLALVVMSGILPTAIVMPGQLDEELSVVLTGANSGLVFIVLQIAFLWVRWQKQKIADYAACRSIGAASGGNVLVPQTPGTDVS
jgi:hypothetical protein